MLEGKNKKGERVRVVKKSGLFRVIVLKSNYVAGRQVEAWKIWTPARCAYKELQRLTNGVSFEEAESIFNKVTGGMT